MKDPVNKISAFHDCFLSESYAPIQTLSYFILTLLGFSFWFFLVVPFASHRETYSWLAGVRTQSLTQQLSFGLSSTYRPLAQVVTWIGFLILSPNIFPTSVVRQALLQGSIYGMFVFAWWLIYSAAPSRRLFALVAFVVGGVFFAGYVHLFHIYGMFYVPVLLTLGALLKFHASRTFDKYELWFAVVAVVLAFWHPFATGLFIGFYFGFYLDTFAVRSRKEHVYATLILLAGMIAILFLVVLFPRSHMPSESRFHGFIISYRTNEFNFVTSFAAFLLAQMTVLSMRISPKLKLASSVVIAAFSVGFIFKGMPLLIIWFATELIKLVRMRSWSLFFLMLTAALLPFGGGIGSPMYVLFAIIVAAYVTSLKSPATEKTLSFLKPWHVMSVVLAAAIIIIMIRLGVQVPIVTSASTPLLAERERTYQLETILAWLHNSKYCNAEIAYVENAGSPIEDVKSAIRRRNRPPASIEDVQLFWNSVLRCPCSDGTDQAAGIATLTFGGPILAGSHPVFVVKGRDAGDATVWIVNSQ